MTFNQPPPVGKLSILQHLINSYKSWHALHQYIARASKYTLAEKIDAHFIEMIELLFAAQYAKPEQKLPVLQKANFKLDTLKCLLQILWEIKSMSTKSYAALSAQLNEVGKMLGGWLRQAQKQNSPAKAGEK